MSSVAAPAFEPPEQRCAWQAGTVFVESEPTGIVWLSIEHDGASAGFAMSPDEARALAAEIVKACDEAQTATPTTTTTQPEQPA